MKNFKAWIVALAVMVVVMIVSGYACADNDRGEFYPKMAVVFQIEKIGGLNVIYCEDKSQNQWSFFDDEDYYKVGDIVNFLMWNMGEREEEDELVEIYKEGHTDNYNSFWNEILAP